MIIGKTADMNPLFCHEPGSCHAGLITIDPTTIIPFNFMIGIVYSTLNKLRKELSYV